jgi:hypothetical protein
MMKIPQLAVDRQDRTASIVLRDVTLVRVGVTKGRSPGF